MITWSGRILAFLGALHLTVGTLLSSRYLGEWLSFQLWFDGTDVTELRPAVGAFWLGPGSFGLPLLLIGLLIEWMDRRDIVPPVFLPWALLAWIGVGAVILEPAPWLVAGVAAVLLLVGVRRSAAAPAIDGVPQAG
ncbi:DUF6463 family protein [Nocardia brasiliensis]|uniref:DUF6463 family protein n=1 Tax=Nocardia brasiliensis TaxID=37326 RepID=UPI00366B2332